MRDLKRNQQPIYYALLVKSKGVDEWGNEVETNGYSDPERLLISRSANKGETAAQAFGADLQYDLEMSTHDMNCPIDEFSRVWIDRNPTEPHNYEVAAVSKSLNCVRYAIKRVNVSYEKTNNDNT